MSLTSGFLIRLGVTAALISTAAAQKGKRPAAPEELSARDMFYHPVKEAPGSGGTPHKTTTADKGKTTTPTPNPNPAKTLPDGGVLIQAAVRQRAALPAEGQPLGLKYTLVKKVKGKEDADVDTDTTFHSGDQIQLKIQANLDAYLYIITQGSSGTWKVQVPSADVPDGSNHVEALRPCYFPSKDLAFTFDDKKGAEKIFVIVSREPVTDIQDQIYGLQGGKPKPAAAPDAAPRPQPATIEARANIPDDQISRLRSLYSRDLIIEKVRPDTTGDKVETKEFARYVVNHSGRPDSRLVADVSLVHE